MNVSEKVPCSKCGAPILMRTAQRTNGLCMPCHGGYRESIEASKREIVEERERDRTDPHRRLWRSLVEQVNNSSTGFDDLSQPKRLYWALNCLVGEVYNGGFDQYFFNYSGSEYAHAEEALIAIGALQTCDLLNEAKYVLFGSDAVPVDTGERRIALRDRKKFESERTSLKQKLDDLDKRFWLDSEGIVDRIEAFARDNRLLIEPV